MAFHSMSMGLKSLSCWNTDKLRDGKVITASDTKAAINHDAPYCTGVSGCSLHFQYSRLQFAKNTCKIPTLMWQMIPEVMVKQQHTNMIAGIFIF